MHAHDRKLDRAGAERIELMEVCPVCGEQRRNSARFCTTCGHRFSSDEIANATLPVATPDSNHDQHETADPVISGWPAPSSETAVSPWAPAPAGTGGWPAPPADPDADAASTDVTWAEVAATALSSQRYARPVSNEQAESDAFEVLDDEDLDAARPDTSASDQLRHHARSLMIELGEVIDGLTGDGPSPGHDLANELEISLIRPAALDGEALSDLRAAAESAQDRPRDLDTLTALTAQAETILALVVGYERATAGIERAIETLRGQPVPKEREDGNGEPSAPPLP